MGNKFTIFFHRSAQRAPSLTEMSKSEQPVVALTIAGTDSGGSAGAAADLKTFAAHGVHGVFAVCLLTAQNSTGIAGLTQVDPDFVGLQIDVLSEDFVVAAHKTGLLYSIDVVDQVVDRSDQLGTRVVDPVLVRSSGEPLVGDDVLDRYRNDLVPSAALVTPNMAEAQLLSGCVVDSVDSAGLAAQRLVELGATAVVVTGVPDNEADVIADVLCTEEHIEVLRHDRVATPNLLGTGCSFSASCTAQLAKGASIPDAVMTARDYVVRGLQSAASWRLGAGQGPIDHMARWRNEQLP